MRDAVCETIDGLKYKVTPLGAGRGARLLVKIAKAVGPALGKQLSAGKLTLDSDIGPGLTELCERLDPDMLDELCKEFADTTTVETSPGKWPQLKDSFDLHFSANYLAMFKWLAFCLRVNYGPLAGLVQTVARAATP